MKGTKRLWFTGILGCICFGITDWLLGFADPQKISGKVFFFIREGHGADFGTNRILASLLLTMLGVFMLYPAMTHSGNIAKNPAWRRTLRVGFRLCSIGWTAIHFILTMNVMVFAEADRIDRHTAEELSRRVSGISMPLIIISGIIIGLPLVTITVLILAGETVLPRAAAIFAPLLPMALVAVIAKLTPENPVSYAFLTFAMDSGLWVWFRYLLAKKLIGVDPRDAQTTALETH